MILPLWGRALSSWRMELGPRFWRYGIATDSSISFRYLTALRLPSMMTSSVLPVREIPPHTMTLPPLKGVTRSMQQSAWRSPRRLHTLILPSSFRRQNLDSSLNMTLPHILRFHCRCCRHQSKRPDGDGQSLQASCQPYKHEDRPCAVRSSPSDQRSVCGTVVQILPVNLWKKAYGSSVK